MLASHPHAIVHLTAALIVVRKDELLQVECAQPEVHHFLVNVPSV